MMIKKIYQTLFLGALKPQRGDHNNVHYFRSLFWLGLSTALYVTSIAHWLFKKQFLAFDQLEGDSYFSLKDFDGSFLSVFILILVFMFVFARSYPDIVVQYKASSRRGYRYRWFLLYHLPSFLAFVFTRGYFLGMLLE